MTRKMRKAAALLLAALMLTGLVSASLGEGEEELIQDSVQEESSVPTEETEEEISAETAELSADPEETAAETATETEPEITMTAEGQDDTANDPSVEETAESEEKPAAETEAEPAAETETHAADAEETESIPEDAAAANEAAPEETKETDDEDELGDLDALFDDEEILDEEHFENWGNIDDEVVSHFIPEVTEELIENSDAILAGETEETTEPEAEENAEPADEENAETETEAGHGWITAEADEEIRVGGELVLRAKANIEFSGEVTWEILDITRVEESWDTIGTGRELTLTVTDDLNGREIRFRTEDGLVSETYRIRALEAAEETAAEEAETDIPAEEEIPASEDVIQDTEADAEEATAEEIPETTEAEAAETEAAADAVEETTEETVEEAAPQVHAFVTVDENEYFVGGQVTLNAAADAELDNQIVWQTRSAGSEDWTKAGYGLKLTVDLTDENADNVFRFRLADGTISEEYSIHAMKAETTEETEETAEAAETVEIVETEEPAEEIGEAMEEAAEIAEETEATPAEETAEEPVAEEADEDFELPENATAGFSISWDNKPAIGETAHFTATVSGLDEFEYTLQWQYSADNEHWEDVEGETGERMDQVLTEENKTLFWRLKVNVTGRK